MEMKRNNRTLLFLVIFFSLFAQFCAENELKKTHNESIDIVADEVSVGVILDMGSLKGKIIHSCISMAIPDFYRVHKNYKTRLVLHSRDSKGEPLHALNAALELWENDEVEVILGAQSSTEANFLAEFADKAKVPVLSFYAPNSSPSSTKYPYFIQITQDEMAQVKGIAAVVEEFKWRNVVLIYEDNDDGRDIIPYMVDYFQENKIHIAYKSAIAVSSKDYHFIEELHKLKALQTTVFIVHMSHPLVSHLFLNAKSLGMLSEGYAWILTIKSMSLFHLMDSSVKESMQGVVGFKPYIPASEELDNFTSRWRTFLAQEPDMDAAELGAFGVWAYDIAWRLMEAAERTRIKVPLARKPDNRLNPMDLDKISTLIRASILVGEILRSRFKGLSGEFHFSNGKLISNMLEIIKIGRAESRIGFWTSEGKITRELHPSYYRRHLSSVTKDLEAVIWPRGSTTIPRGRVMQMTSKTLRIGVVQNSGFPELVHVYHDLQTNTTTFTGFSIEVFKAAIESLPYAVRYEFIPIEPYRDPVDQVYLQKYDAAVGDITITANRSIYVDFTLPYTDLGVGMVSRKDNKNLWIFLQPLTADLWLTSAGFFILTGFVVWLIERPINQEFQGSLSQQIGMIFWFSFSTLVFAHRERLESNLSRFVVLVWVFVVLVLTSSYTATLTSMMTIQQIQLNSNENNYIGYQHGSFAPEVLSNLNFKDSNLRPLDSPNDYANALSKGSKKVVSLLSLMRYHTSRSSLEGSLLTMP